MDCVESIDHKGGDPHSEPVFRLICETSSDLIRVMDLDTIITYANPSHERVLGYRAHELVGTRGFSLIHPEDREPLERALRDGICNLQRSGETSLSERHEYRVRDVRGMYHMLQSTACLTREAIICISRDITVEKELQAKLAASEARYRILVENSRDAIAVVNAEGVFLFMNTAAADRLGGAPEDFVGRSQWDLFPKHLADQQMACIREVIKTGKGMCAVSESSVQGRLRWFDTAIEPLQAYDEEDACAIVMARDIDDFKRMQERSGRYREDMIRAEHLASLGTVSAMLAHELNQPLTVIRLGIENALARCSIDKCDNRENLSDCIREVGVITDLMKRFRRFGQRSRDQRIEPVRLHEVAKEILSLFERAAGQARIDMQLDHLETLAPVASNVRDMNQMFFGLIENAFQAAEGKEGCAILIQGTQLEQFVELKFSDTCGGIAPDHLDRIFEPFFTTKPQGASTGLGLCVIEQIISGIGGKIWVRNLYGEGVTFFVHLPIAKE